MFQVLINFIHMLSLTCWLGSIVFFSFFAAPAVFQTLEREQAGDLIGKMFPRYYWIGYVCGGLLLITLLTNHPTLFNIKMIFLLVMMACTFYAGLAVRPQAAELKARIRTSEPGETLEALEGKFKSIHSLSVKLNATVLVVGLGFLWLTADGLNL